MKKKSQFANAHPQTKEPFIFYLLKTHQWVGAVQEGPDNAEEA